MRFMRLMRFDMDSYQCQMQRNDFLQPKQFRLTNIYVLAWENPTKLAALWSPLLSIAPATGAYRTLTSTNQGAERLTTRYRLF